jgi:hypothetical protein
MSKTKKFGQKTQGVNEHYEMHISNERNGQIILKIQ